MAFFTNPFKRKKSIDPKNPKEVFPEARHVIEHAFTVGGRDYFRFVDHLNVPYERALTCLVYYREVDMNIDHEFLKRHLLAIDKELTGSSIGIYRIKQLNDQLRERLELPKDPELLYKLASVIFFDKDERPEVYDWTYNKRKIDFWKEHASLTDFFLQTPIVELIPYLQYVGQDLDTFSRITTDANAKHSASLSAN